MVRPVRNRDPECGNDDKEAGRRMQQVQSGGWLMGLED